LQVKSCWSTQQKSWSSKRITSHITSYSWKENPYFLVFPCLTKDRSIDYHIRCTLSNRHTTVWCNMWGNLSRWSISVQHITCILYYSLYPVTGQDVAVSINTPYHNLRSVWLKNKMNSMIDNSTNLKFKLEAPVSLNHFQGIFQPSFI
jgi:hypothetical protein